jgi:thiamine biosynthesis lipoprotein
MKRSFLLVISYLAIFILCSCQKQELHKESRVMMGTFVEVVSPDKKAASIVFAEIQRVEGLLSKYKEGSDIWQLNRSGKWVVNPDTLYVIREAKKFWQMSNGAFDITVAPLVELWGFKDKKYSVLQEEKIKATLKLVGMDKIIFNDFNNMVEFKVLGMQIDLGAIAKGYAVDCAVDKLRRQGIKSCVINAGGQIYCLGNKFGKPWKVAIKDPRQEDFYDFLKLKDKAVSTSGDYEQYFIRGKKRYSHIFNPKTGYPAESDIISVTVVASDGLTADALATSIFVLGKEKGKELIKKFPDVKVKIIEAKDNWS